MVITNQGYSLVIKWFSCPDPLRRSMFLGSSIKAFNPHLFQQTQINILRNENNVLNAIACERLRRRKMIIVRKSKERRHIENMGHKTWMTFGWENKADPLQNGFGVLKILNEEILPPGNRIHTPYT